MLSRRMVKPYLNRARGLDWLAVAKGLKQTQREFATGLNELRTADAGRVEIRHEPNRANRRWDLFRCALSMVEHGGRFMPLIVATTAGPQLRSMHDLTTLHAWVARA